MAYTLKRLLVGKAKKTAAAIHERLTKKTGLAVFASDALSSTAYASEEILLVLAVAYAFGQTNGFNFVVPITFAIAIVLVIVAISYRQTIFAYPSGGGAYIVAKENLGTTPGLVAAAALLVDYVLTVSVSISAGVAAITSAAQGTRWAWLDNHKVFLCLGLIALIALANLRGVRESGTIFAIPTYIFIVSTLLLIAVGCIKAFFLQHQPVIGHFQYVAVTEPLSIFLILKSFAAGCSAMTGVEAISNGVPAFKKPETRNAAITLTWMATILGTLFLGITLLATSYRRTDSSASCARSRINAARC